MPADIVATEEGEVEVVHELLLSVLELESTGRIGDSRAGRLGRWRGKG